jgi:sulfotransferase 6B1
MCVVSNRGHFRRFRHNPIVRAVGVPLYQATARMRTGRPPRVLANSLPKAGTHLLTALLAELPDMRFSGEHLTAFDLQEDGEFHAARLEKRLGRVRDGQYVSAHLPAWPEVFSTVERHGYRSVFIVRDPRDTVVSDVFYILGFRRHPLHQRLHAIPTMEERLMVAIRGLPDEHRGVPLLESMAARLEAYRGWLSGPSTQVVRFEDLVGSRGGGDDAKQLAEIQAIAEHVGRPLTDEQVQSVATRVWSPRSSTFRRGAIGDWRNHFTSQHVDAVKETAGQHLIELGYERD